jgi:ribonucleoside-diphosphate reductase alpha chain
MSTSEENYTATTAATATATHEEKEMRVKKRDGTFQNIAFDKILNRVKNLGKMAGITSINYSSLIIKVIDQLYDGISTTKIDELTAEQCATLSTLHLDYITLASYITVSNNHKNTSDSFYDAMKTLYENKNGKFVQSPLVSNELMKIVTDYKEVFETAIQYKRDYLIEYFGFKTLEYSYLMKINGKIIERPQHMWLRVAIGIHGDDLKRVKETYDLMSQKYFTHATPTLFNAGTPRPQLSSCYLIAMEEDSLTGIFNTLSDCAHISKWAGGIGLHIHNIRSKGSLIAGTNGSSTGIVPMLRVFNGTARYVDQGGRRNGSFAIYLEPWHADICDFLELKKNHGDEELKARDLFYALWIPDLFMRKVKNNEEWCLFSPSECPGLSDMCGDEFESLYHHYESEKREKARISARDLWFKIMDSQMETGTPYLLYKDACNKKSNQQNLGVIKSSNLCCEVVQYSDDTETAVCNLASVALNKFVKPATATTDSNEPCYDFEALHAVTKIVTYNLNRIIDINYYPTEKTKKSNLRHRPIGIGVQGLADVFMMMNCAFSSNEAKELNKKIFETMYHAALESSMELAKLHGPYETFKGSPASDSILQFDMWDYDPGTARYDWAALKTSVFEHGLRNSLLLAPMPTASTSQILGNNEAFEPITSNIYTRRTMAGEFIVMNKYLMRELIDMGLWNERLKNNIIANRGSIQHLTHLSEHVRNKYKTVWEIPMKDVIDMSADRAVFICQSQSLNLWMEEPNYKSLTSMHFYAWSKGLKTGLYYLRRKPKHQAQQFTIEPSNKTATNGENDDGEKMLNLQFYQDEEEENVCTTCSS